MAEIIRKTIDITAARAVAHKGENHMHIRRAWFGLGMALMVLWDLAAARICRRHGISYVFEIIIPYKAAHNGICCP
jgi:hypothetical protein